MSGFCPNPVQIPNDTISSGSYVYSDQNALKADGLTVNGSASVSATAGPLYPAQDHLGSTRMVFDRAGVAEVCLDYLPHGEPVPQGVGARTGTCWAAGHVQTFAVTAEDDGGVVLASLAVRLNVSGINQQTQSLTVDGTGQIGFAHAGSRQLTGRGAAQAVTPPGVAVLMGSVSGDWLPAGFSLSVQWTKVSEPGEVTFDNALQTYPGYRIKPSPRRRPRHVGAGFNQRKASWGSRWSAENLGKECLIRKWCNWRSSRLLNWLQSLLNREHTKSNSKETCTRSKPS